MFKRRRLSSASSTTSQESAPVGIKKPRLSTTAPMYSQQRGVFDKGNNLDDTQKQWAALGAWFMGPKAENGEVFRELLTQAVDNHIGFRRK